MNISRACFYIQQKLYQGNFVLDQNLLSLSSCTHLSQLQDLGIWLKTILGLTALHDWCYFTISKSILGATFLPVCSGCQQHLAVLETGQRQRLPNLCLTTLVKQWSSDSTVLLLPPLWWMCRGLAHISQCPPLSVGFQSDLTAKDVLILPQSAPWRPPFPLNSLLLLLGQSLPWKKTTGFKIGSKDLCY